MSEWRVVIADDEPAARRGVRQLLSRHPAFNVVGECRDGREAVCAFDTLKPDVMFLDIQMPEMHGFDVLRHKPVDNRTEIVFLTAYDQFAIKAFEAEALDYLVKPVSDARFSATIARLVKRLQAPVSPAIDDRVFIPGARGGVIVRLRDVEWIEAADNYVRLWAGSKRHLLRESLGQLEERASGLGFIRAHRNALVRRDAVVSIHTGEDGELVAQLASGARVGVSRRRRAAFREAISR